MTDDTPHFDDTGRLIAPQYDDVYFSAEDGLAETEHVFLEGNRLRERFAALKPGERFTIGETGFGTGLNFLAAWRLFEKHAPADAQLDFMSVEGFPLDHATMQRALSPWPALSEQREALLQQWGPIWPGLHRFRFAGGRVRLTLLVGEVVEALAGVDASVDAWFLDGFAPSRNPAMWSDAVFKELARLSACEATLATYTAAGFVRRGLSAVGFDVHKQPGFGTKRDMTVGRIQPELNLQAVGSGHCGLPSAEGRSAIVIGGSLAGAFAARTLAERGIVVTVIEQQSVQDGELPSLTPRVAVLQPKINSIDDPAGRWLREGYAFVQRWLSSDDRLANQAGWLPCGSFQTRPADRSIKSLKHIDRIKRFCDQFADTGLCRWIDADATDSEVGLPMPCGGAIFDHAGLLRPAGLCAALLDHPMIKVRDCCQATSLQRDGQNWKVQTNHGDPHTASTVVIANALDAQGLDQTKHLQLKPVRGQVTLLDSTTQSGGLVPLTRAVFYGGYLLPEYHGVQTLGASFVPGDDAVDWRNDEHLAACEKLYLVLRDERVVHEAARLKSIESVQGWAGVRTTTPNHRCYAREIEPGLYVSLGHGSHGISSAAAAGEHLAALMTNGVRAK